MGKWSMAIKVKYPKTLHFPWSEGLINDDRRITTLNHLIGKEVVVTEKLDGENTTMYSDAVHARSIDSKHHESRVWVKSKQGQIGHNIPENYRVCGENMYAKHSIHYRFLTDYFYVFGIYKDNLCLSWDDTLLWASNLGLQTVPVLYRGPFDEKIIKNCWTNKSFFSTDEVDPQEGYVVRVANEFPIEQHHLLTAKFVRKNHVQTDEHWLNQPIIKNLLRKPE